MTDQMNAQGLSLGSEKNQIRVLYVGNAEMSAIDFQKALLSEEMADKFWIIRVIKLQKVALFLEKYSFDVIVYDLDFSEGDALTNLLRILEYSGDIPIIALTNNSDEKLGVQAVELGAQDYIQKANLHPLQMAQAIKFAISRERMKQKLRDKLQSRYQNAVSDELTGLLNRQTFSEHLDQGLTEARRSRKRLALMTINLDNFKSINSELGASVGDRILKIFASRLKTCLPENQTLARMGGDEFGVILYNIEGPQQASVAAEAILNACAKAYQIDSQRIQLSCSIGISVYPLDSVSSVRLLEMADSAMLQAKARGKNTYLFYSPLMNAHLVDRQDLENQLLHALERKEFEVHYQPIVDLRSGEIRSVEAFLRWNHPTMGLISTSNFLDFAEKTGLILAINDWMIETGFQDLKHFPESVSINFNLSQAQLRSEIFPVRLESLLRKYSVDAQRVLFDLREDQVFKGHPVSVMPVITALRRLGVQIALDDYGKGLASLSSIQRLEASCVKIDSSILQAAHGNHAAEAMMEAIVRLAKGLQIKVIAEGVETQDQLLKVIGMGCDQAQGYFIGMPTGVSGIEQVITKMGRAAIRM